MFAVFPWPDSLRPSLPLPPSRSPFAAPVLPGMQPGVSVKQTSTRRKKEPATDDRVGTMNELPSVFWIGNSIRFCYTIQSMLKSKPYIIFIKSSDRFVFYKFHAPKKILLTVF